MKQNRPFPHVSVTPKAETSLRKGHPWVYDTEVLAPANAFSDGALVDILSPKGAWLGTGLWSGPSKIRLRLLSSNPNDRYDEAFFLRRIRYAVEYRRTVMGSDFSACRLIFGEADGLPGVTVDYYDGLLVSQLMSVGMDRRKELLYRSLCRVLTEEGFPVNGIFERNESPLRDLEGLPCHKGWVEADFLPPAPSPVTEICENGVFYSVDVENGQKTGFFLDQKYNRLAVSKLCAGRRVLDCFTHTGSFALNAATGGASHVTAVDISQTALEMAKANAVRNGLDPVMDFVCADVFDLLPTLHGGYDFIILDPPAFTKSRRTADAAAKGYKEINYRAMKLLPRGGYLATCSCSHFMETAMFRKVVQQAASDAGVSLRLVEARAQSPDHPILLNVPETDYLKFFIFQIV
ncbi:MAG: class I SAM-dependent rRNA methyltransferase [Clostridia bacterium]|nr:class I SAM-dependent rRNA methyltransferase [Clostridia bacterium]